MEDEVKSKLCRCIFWVVVLTILFFLMGAWLKSDGKVFDLNKFYELFKDSLSMGFTLLALVSVFIFYSDWRIEHRATKADENIEFIIYNFKKVCESLVGNVEQIYYSSVANNPNYSPSLDLDIICSDLENSLIDIKFKIEILDSLDVFNKTPQFIEKSKELLKECEFYLAILDSGVPGDYDDSFEIVPKIVLQSNTTKKRKELNDAYEQVRGLLPQQKELKKLRVPI